MIEAGLGSTDLLYFASGTLDLPGAMFTASHNPAQYNGIKLCRAGREAGRAGHRARRDPRARAGATWTAGAPTAATRRAPSSSATCWRTTRRYLRGLVDLTGIRPLKVVVDAGNGMGGYTVPAVLGDRLPPAADDRAAVLRAGRLVPQPRGQPAGAGEPGRPAGEGPRARRRPRAWPSTATPTAASSSTSAASRLAVARSPRWSRCGSWPSTRRHDHPQPDHLPGGAGDRRASTAACRCAPGSGTRSSRPRWPRTGAVFGGEHSAHYYFRDFWGADTGMLAAMHVLAALGGRTAPLSELTSEYERYAASGEINSTVADPAGEDRRGRGAPTPGARSTDLDGLTWSSPTAAGSTCAPSNTEPLLRLNVEAPTAERMAALRDEVLAIIRG